MSAKRPVSAKVGNARLLKLAAFLRELPKGGFDFGTIVEERNCGTVGCALGWTPVALPKLAEYATINGRKWSVKTKGDVEGWSPSVMAQGIFRLSKLEAAALFYPSSRQCSLPNTATSKQVAEHIEKFVAKRTKAAL